MVRGMSEGSKLGLFETLPEQGPTERLRAAPRLRQAERRQVSLRPVSLEDLLPANHQARFVWAFAERLDLSALYGAIKAVEGHPGHPPADPRILLALWLHATVEGVGGARELDRLKVHRARLTRDWLAEHRAEIEVHYLPSYSPEPSGQCPIGANFRLGVLRACKSFGGRGWIPFRSAAGYRARHG